MATLAFRGAQPLTGPSSSGDMPGEKITNQINHTLFATKSVAKTTATQLT